MSSLRYKFDGSAWAECIRCGLKYGLDEVRYTCSCGGLLEIRRDLAKLDPRGLLEKWEARRMLKRGPLASGVWRYKELVIDVPEELIVTKLEGNTRLYPAGSAGEYAGMDSLLLKHEGENPTSSFKDRGMTCGVTAARIYGAGTVACASTGNTSASMAAYAAQCGMKAVIFIPSGKIAYGKLAQALAYGGLTFQIDGNFDDAMELVQKICAEMDIYLLNSINPFRLEGQKAICFETLQQLDWNPPDWFIVPGGNLGNNSALSKALMELHQLGIIRKIPRIAVIQAEGANPLYRMWKDGTDFRPVGNPETIATAIKIGNPVSWEKSMKGIKWSNGVVEQVGEQEIMDAKAMVDRAGIGAEPASCCVVAGARKLVRAGVISRGESAVGILTGGMLKDPDAIIGYHTDTLRDRDIAGSFANRPLKVKADLDSIKKALGEQRP